MIRLVLAVLLLASGAAAAAVTAGISVTGAWVRASLGQLPTTAAYIKVENKGTTEDRLLSVSTPAAAMANLHESVSDNGIMKMNAVPALVIKPGQTAELAPGGMHIMVMSLKAPLKAGATMPLVLKFEKAGEIRVEAEVRGLK